MRRPALLARLAVGLAALLSVAMVTSYLSPVKTTLMFSSSRMVPRPSIYDTMQKSSKEGDIGDRNASDALEKSLLNAKRNIESKSSPGANLETADEQADAAFADIIYSSMQQRGITELSEDEKALLAKGATMWEKGAMKEKKSSLFGNILSVVEALSGGAHITKNEFGET